MIRPIPRTWLRGVALAGALAATVGTGPPSRAQEEYVPRLSFLDPVPAAATTPSPLLDFSVVRDGTESTLRVPLAGREEPRGLSRVVPYLSVGSTIPTDSSIRENTVPYENAVRAQRTGMDMGAGVAVKLSNSVELFGEYRFLRVNPDPTEAVGGVLHRDVDGPYLKGGFSIKLP